MLTAARMAEVDRNAAALGVPRAKLMESSGNAVARAVRERCEPGASVRLLCGRGNNGGDALVAARFLSAYDVSVELLGRPATIRTEIARDNWAALEATGVETTTCRDSSGFELGDPDLIVDAMLGTGVTGALREPAATVARVVSEADAPVVAVDVPSGVDADTGCVAGGDADAEAVVAGDPTATRSAFVDADSVVTFHDAKPGLTELADRGAFDLTVADIGIPPAAERVVGPGDLRPLTRASDSHKGDNGEVLVVGGGPYAGAPTLAARAAIRAGGDLVRVAVPSAVAGAVQGFDESLIVRSLSGDRLRPEHVDRLHELAAGSDTVVVGPGLGADEETLAAVESFLGAYDGTAVVDADALRVVPDLETDARLICTPHRGEFARMGGDPDGDADARATAVEAFAAGLSPAATLLVKGPVDVISDGETTRRSRTGNPGMTVGGTGDVLAGVTGALAAVLAPTRAAALAAWANGRAGDAAHAASGDGLAATDLIDELPTALRDEEVDA
ncbi:NAD(P)H-hydrate dehydratase [Halobaculum sp. MBLA0143]|uniref:NAD(P)H-hydrate dehydratase n=1 Tax=Halobaculum sp. MBLA0143 TaxID=3079933 RepID=UPI003525E772